MSARSGTRRDKIRQATLEEIREAARRLLTTRGPAAVTINAVAREMGMSGPALYHYYAGHEELVAAVTADFFRELAEVMEEARDRDPAASPAGRLLATCRAMRTWAIGHPAEFSWIFATPIPASVSAKNAPGSPRSLAGRDFERVFLEEIEALWASRRFPVPSRESLGPSNYGQLEAYAKTAGHALPPEALHVALSCWIRLYGLLCMEVLNQLDFAYSDLAPVYEECLRDLSRTLDLDYEPPATT
ncbi:TetR/AcrR family transcriptional regulator [Spirillospora sp. CA-255316]